MGGQLEHREHIPVKTGTPRGFAFLFAVLFAAASGYFWIAGKGGLATGLGAISAILGLMGLIRPQLLRWPNLLWIKLGFLLGAVVSPIILSLIFAIFVTPLALLSRMFGHDPLRIRMAERDRNSFWISREHNDHTVQSMSQQY